MSGSGRVPYGRRAAARGVATGLALAAAVAGSLTAPGAAWAAGGAEGPAAGPELGECAKGELCLWAQPRFKGERRTYERSKVPLGSCRRLPQGGDAASFANRTGRPVTVYESGECAETRDFHTHPSGSWTPEGAYRVRAFKVWER